MRMAKASSILGFPTASRYVFYQLSRLDLCEKILNIHAFMKHHKIIFKLACFYECLSVYSLQICLTF